jgi:AmmeMemoRadiSam system protein A
MDSLDQEQRDFLLQLARTSIAARLDGLPPPDPSVPAGPLTEHRGAFVTLTIEGALRGCIGHVVGIEPLWSSVRSNAVAAAFRDPRFPPVDRYEFDRVAIEISAMSALDPLTDPGSIEIGRHGLMVEQAAARGLLLPQVASDRGWDSETFLAETCRKAGLESGCWKHRDSRLFTFTVEHFAEP